MKRVIEVRVEDSEVTTTGKRYVVLVDGRLIGIRQTKGELLEFLDKVI